MQTLTQRDQANCVKSLTNAKAQNHVKFPFFLLFNPRFMRPQENTTVYLEPQEK